LGRSEGLKRRGLRIRRYLVLLRSPSRGSMWVKIVEAASKEEAKQLSGAGPSDLVLTEADARKLAKFLGQTANWEAWGPLAFRIPT